VNQRTEARGLQKRYRGKGWGKVRIEIGARIEIRIEVRVITIEGKDGGRVGSNYLWS
jgi:hypothetical protein